MWLCDYVAVAVWLWLWLCREQPGALLCGFLTCWRLQVRDLPASGVPSGHRAVAIVRVPQPAVRVRRQQPSVRGDCVLACRGLLRCADRGLRVVAPATWTCSLSPTSAWDETRRRFRWVLAHCVCACACVCACVCSYSDAFSMAGFLAMCLFLKGFRCDTLAAVWMWMWPGCMYGGGSSCGGCDPGIWASRSVSTRCG